MCKKILDTTVSFIALVIFSPIFVVVSACIVLDSRGPVFFTQSRVGRNGGIFKMYKFRSMSVNSEKEGPHFTAQGDSRVTKVGRVIRKTSIDELPQLLNVLIGNMSLVGPRPNVEIQESEYTQEEWNKRNSVKPGITGLAQATLRSRATVTQRTQLDLEYVDTRSLLADIRILCLTFKQIILRGSH